MLRLRSSIFLRSARVLRRFVLVSRCCGGVVVGRPDGLGERARKPSLAALASLVTYFVRRRDEDELLGAAVGECVCCYGTQVIGCEVS